MDLDTRMGDGTTADVQWVHGSPATREREVMTSEDNGKMQPEESSDDEWHSVMQQMFQDQTAPTPPGSPTSRLPHGQDLDLPLVLYQPLRNIFIQLQALSQSYSNPAVSVTPSSSSVTSSSVFPSGTITQPGPGGFILVNAQPVYMAGSFTRYPEFSGRGNYDIEQHWYLCEAI